MDPMRDMYMTSCCTASIESSFMCSSASPAYHQYHQSYAPSNCHTVGWEAYQQHCSSYPRPETAVHSPTGPPSLYPVTQSSHTSSASVGLPPYKFTTSAELPPSVASRFSQPPATMLCDEQQQIISVANQKINEEKVKVEDFHSSMRAVTSEGINTKSCIYTLTHYNLLELCMKFHCLCHIT